jgi:hypothetical protein
MTGNTENGWPDVSPHTRVLVPAISSEVEVASPAGLDERRLWKAKLKR